MLYMVIEKFYPEKVRELYETVSSRGRQLPEGVHYVNSWIDLDIETCYQVMESDSLEKLVEWTGYWQAFADFTIIPVVTSAEAREIVLSR